MATFGTKFTFEFSKEASGTTTSGCTRITAGAARTAASNLFINPTRFADSYLYGFAYRFASGYTFFDLVRNANFFAYSVAASFAFWNTFGNTARYHFRNRLTFVGANLFGYRVAFFNQFLFANRNTFGYTARNPAFDCFHLWTSIARSAWIARIAFLGAKTIKQAWTSWDFAAFIMPFVNRFGLIGGIRFEFPPRVHFCATFRYGNFDGFGNGFHNRFGYSFVFGIGFGFNFLYHLSGIFRNHNFFSYRFVNRTSYIFDNGNHFTDFNSHGSTTSA